MDDHFVFSKTAQSSQHELSLVSALEESNNDTTKHEPTSPIMPERLDHDSKHSMQHEPRSPSVFEGLRTELARHQIDVSGIYATDFAWLSEDTANAADLQRLKHCAILTTNDQVLGVLDLQLSLPNTPPLTLGTHHYFRAWTFEFAELLAVIQHMKDDDHYFQETRAWKRIIEGYTGSITKVTIRYVGTVQGPRRPIDRYLEDLGMRTSGLLAEFARAISVVCPHVEAQAKIFLIPEASLPFTETIQRKENVERMLIALFDYTTLLNRQLGGFLVSYVPPAGDNEYFAALRTDVGARFRASSQGIIPPGPAAGVERRFYVSSQITSPSLLSGLEIHFKQLQAYANSNPEICGTSHHSISDELCAVLLAQAIPTLYKGQNLTVYVGKDLPVEEFLSPTHFLGVESHAGNFVRQTLESVARIEASNHGREFQHSDFSPYEDSFCIVDLWCWLKHDHLAPASEFLRKYLELVQPLVVTIFGRDPVDLILSDFDVNCNRRLQNLTPVVGVPSIQYHDQPGANEAHDPNAAFVAIPAFHPGRDKHGSQTQPIRRLVDISMKHTFLVTQIAMDILDEPDVESRFSTRFDLCQEILHRLNNLSQEGNNFLLLLEKTKADVESILRHSMTKSETDDARSMLDRDAYEILLSFGIARGDAGSNERISQIDSLWDDEVALLHLVFSHIPELKRLWMNQFLQLAPRQSLLLAAIAGVHPDAYADMVMSLLRPEWQEPGSWLENQPYTIQYGLWVHRGESESLKNRVMYPDQVLTAFDLQARPIGFPVNGIARRADGKILTVDFNLPKSAIPKGSTESRALVYILLGIDLVDGNGRVFRSERSGRATLGATIPRQAIISQSVKRELWLEVLNAHGIDPLLEDNEDDDAADDWGRKGVAMLSPRAKSITPRQSTPPKPNDANYPLYFFLEQSFPHGGNFDLASLEKYSMSKEHTKAFVDLLKTPRFRKHPYSKEWLEKLDLPLPSTEQSSSPTVQRATHKRDEYLLIGPPGSAVPDPFDMMERQCCISQEVMETYLKNKKNVSTDVEESVANKRTSKYPIKGSQKRSKQRI
ncbi:hypothetical protein E4T47_04533 [Aureobasidium subglaciale]|nr:hypothetical protein E4T47_04533 [Aureobasidium subglaciale]